MLFKRVLKWVRYSSFWINHEGTIYCCPQPRKVSVPEKGTLLVHQCELIRKRLASLNWTLGNV